MSELDDYKQKVKEQLTKICRVIAQISAGNYSEHLNLFPIATEEYSEFLFGLDILLNDLIKTRRDLEIQQAYHKTRAEIWRRASMAYDSPQEMLDNLLSVLIEAFNLDVAGYLVAGKEDENYRCLAAKATEEINYTVFSLPKSFISPPSAECSYCTIALGDESPLFHGDAPDELRISADAVRKLKLKSMMGVFAYDAVSSANVGVVIGSKNKRQWNTHEEHTIASMTMICHARTLQLKMKEELATANMRLEKEVAARTGELNNLNMRLTNDLIYREQVERKLRENMELYRALVETIPDSILVVVSDGTIRRINSASLNVFHARNEKELIDHNIAEFIEEYDLTTTKAYKTLERQVKCCDGNSCLCEITITDIVFSGPNQDAARLCLVHDITERRRQESELARIQSLESIGILAGGIAHDFNNILSGVAGNLYLARELYPKEPQKSLSLLDVAHHSIIKAKHLTGQLLTFAKGGAPIKETLSIKNILDEAATYALAGSKMAYHFAANNKLKLVEGDPTQLVQVFSNLLLNAAQEMQQGTIDLEAETVDIKDYDEEHSLPDGTYVHIMVADRGGGISAEKAPYIFHPYYTTKKQGTGLGLTVVYSIVQHHGGVVYHAPRDGGGTIFHVFLPASNVEEQPLKVKEKSSVTDNVEITNKRLLLMDDDEDILTMLGELFTFMGYEPSLAKNGEEALKIYKESQAKKQPFAVVILDLTITGGMGGKETIGELKQLDPDVYAIVASGYSNDPVLASYKEYGFKDILTKPYTMEELKEVLKRAFNSKQLQEPEA